MQTVQKCADVKHHKVPCYKTEVWGGCFGGHVACVACLRTAHQAITWLEPTDQILPDTRYFEHLVCNWPATLQLSTAQYPCKHEPYPVHLYLLWQHSSADIYPAVWREPRF